MDNNSKDIGQSKSEYIIQNIVGCGPFQVILIFLVFIVTKLSTAYTMMFMAFGNYNPGWRCLDPNGTAPNDTSSINNSAGGYVKDDCPVFDSCTNIEFEPGTSTIVSEWGLLCDKAWIPSIIISIQMVGLLVGSFLAGHLGDTFGRKTTIYSSQALVVVLNVISIFSISWQMFAVLRFFLGIATACIAAYYYVYTAEFVTMKWRGPLPNIPFWPGTCILFAVTAMCLKDWRDLHIVTAATALVGFLPVFWVPESLRWLEVKEKTKRFESVVKQIAAVNGKTLPPLDSLVAQTTPRNEHESSPKVCTMAHIFKKGYRLNTFLLTVPWFSMSLIFYAIGFGVKALNGDFYLNLIIMYVVEIPFTILPTVSSNVLGRKWSGILFSGLTGVCLLTAACFDYFTTGESKTTGVLVLVLAGRVCMGGLWGIMMTYIVELYPTVVRGMASGWGNSWSRIGGIAAPFLIPNDKSMVFICYIIMGALAMLCSGVIVALPETRGRALKETFDDHSQTEQNEIPAEA